jgi:hypothetical protein
MSIEKINTGDSTNLTVTRGGSSVEPVELRGVYNAVCYDKNGNEKWSEAFPNAVTTQGKNALLDRYFGGGVISAGTQGGPFANTNANRFTWYMGLIVSNNYSAIATADTHVSHAGWIESGATNGLAPGYSQATRRKLTFSASSSGSKATSNAVVFSVDRAGTIKGAFIANSAVKASINASAVLYSAGLFTVGDKIVTAGDTLNVTYTASA